MLNGSQAEAAQSIIHLKYRFQRLLTSCGGFYILRKQCAGSNRNHKTAGIHHVPTCCTHRSRESQTASPLSIPACYLLQLHGCLLATTWHNSSFITAADAIFTASSVTDKRKKISQIRAVTMLDFHIMIIQIMIILIL